VKLNLFKQTIFIHGTCTYIPYPDKNPDITHAYTTQQGGMLHYSQDLKSIFHRKIYIYCCLKMKLLFNRLDLHDLNLDLHELEVLDLIWPDLI
jgi:hypothetical protein